MIRGINKRIIEINDIGSEYFEKALFIVKDNKATVPSLEREASRVLESYFPRVNTENPGFLRGRSLKRRRLSLVLCLGAVGLAITAVVLGIILL